MRRIVIGRRTFLSFLPLFGFARSRGAFESVDVKQTTIPPALIPDSVSCPEPDPSKVLQEARSLAESGHFEEALLKHIWYHENAIRIQPSQLGVRLPFALQYWEELGEKYPEARSALIAIQERNRDTIVMGKCNFSLFQEIAGIDRHLGAQSRTVESFRSLRKIDPKLAEKCYGLAEEALVAQGAYTECLEYLVDPSLNLQRFVEFREELRDRGSPHEFQKLAADALFTERASRLVTILAKGGKTAEAEKIRNAALLTLDNETIRNAGN